MRRLLVLAALALSVLALGGCSADDSGGGIQLPGGTAPTVAPSSSTTVAP